MTSSPSIVDQVQNPTSQNDPRVFQKYLVGIDDTAGSKEYIIDEKFMNYQSKDAPGSSATNVNFQDQLQLENKHEEELIQKLRAQNTAYREQLKTLSEQLSEIISKHKVTKAETTLKQITNPSPDSNQEGRIQMEIESGRKSLTIYKRELKQLKSKCEEIESPIKRAAAEDKVFAINVEIEKEHVSKKQLTKLIREKTKQIEQFQSDATVSQKGTVIQDDLKAVKEKFRQVTFNQERLANQAQSRENYVIKLERELALLKDNYKVAVDRTGYVEKLDKTKVKVRSVSRMRPNQNSNPVPLPNTTSIWKNKEDETELLAFNEENFEKLMNKMKIVKKVDLGKEKTFTREVQDLEYQVQIAERERDLAKGRFSETDKEMQELDRIFKELSNIASQQNVLLPSEERKRQRVIERGSLTSRTQDNIQLPTISSRGNKDDKDARKRKDNSVEKVESKEFNDRDIIGNHNVKIYGVRVWYDGKRLNGIQGFYRTHNGRKFEGKKHIKDQYKYKVTKFELEGDDFLKELSGHLNAEGDTVECLIFKSFYGQSRKVGQASENSRLFRFDISANEFPAVFYGSMRDEEDMSVLAKLGVLIASDEVKDENAGEEDQDSNFFDKTSVPSKRSSQISIV